MENFSAKINDTVKDLLDDSDDKTVVYDLSTSTYFGGDVRVKIPFNNFISTVTTTHPNTDVKLVYLGEEDFNWMVDSDTISKKDPLIVLSMPFSHTYVYNYMKSQDVSIKDTVTFVYIRKYKPTDEYKP